MTTMFSPLKDRVLVRKIAPSNQTAGGLVLPASAVQPATEGWVLGVGPDVDEVSEGDKVLFGPRGGTEVSIDGEKLYLFRIDDIYGVFWEEE